MIDAHNVTLVIYVALLLLAAFAVAYVWRRVGLGSALLLVLILGAMATWMMRGEIIRKWVPDCKTAERAAQAAGDTVFYDCESLGLAVNFPLLGTIGALLLVLAIAGFRRLFRR